MRLLALGKIINHTTENIIEELIRVFNNASVRKFTNEEDEKLVIDGYISKSIIIKPLFNEKIIIEDPSDDKFINCALTSKSNIVSGDSHLLNLKNYKGIKIMNAKEFLESLR